MEYLWRETNNVRSVYLQLQWHPSGIPLSDIAEKDLDNVQEEIIDNI